MLKMYLTHSNLLLIQIIDYCTLQYQLALDGNTFCPICSDAAATSRWRAMIIYQRGRFSTPYLTSQCVKQDDKLYSHRYGDDVIDPVGVLTRLGDST